MNNNVELSIIIVNFNVVEKVISCINSIYNSKAKKNFEIILVDNSEKDNISKILKNKFSKVKYVKSEKNLGYGAGNNLGVKHATGEYIFILNPDTELIDGKIETLINFIKKNKKTGAVAPLLLDKKRIAYERQGMRILTPRRAIFSLSFISKLLPKNKYLKEYFQLPWDKKEIKKTEIVPGTAFIIKKSLFEKLGGFDENFFLYFEEFDFCKRLIDEGYKNYIIPDVKFSHEWGASTQLIGDNEKDKYFKLSRFYYFKKNFGILNALITELFLRLNKYTLFIFLVLSAGLFLRTFRLNELMVFFPDMGVWYLPAKDLLIHGTFPLLGMETSHPWIHHGPHWIYVLSILLWLSDFNPVPPAYFFAILGTLTVLIFYVATKNMFSIKIATLASILFATSPLLITNSRIPYHTSPIPFFVITLFYFTYKWIKGDVWIFPAITFMLGVLYNHEITTFVYSIVIGILLFYGFLKKEFWFKKLKDIKIILLSIIGFLIPMAPFIIYDFKTLEFNQTLRFLAWVGYRVVKFPLSIIHPSFKSSGSSPSTINQFFIYYKDLIFSESGLIAIIIFILTAIFIFVYFYKHFGIGGRRFIKIKRKMPLSYALLFLFLFISLLGLSTHRVPIEADTLLIAPIVIILTAISILFIFKNKFLPSLIIVLLIAFINIYSLLSTNFFTQVNGQRIITYQDKLRATEKVIKVTDGKPYNLEVKGVLDNFKSFGTPYEYLLWWKGSAPSEDKQNLKIIIWEKDNIIEVFKENE